MITAESSNEFPWIKSQYGGWSCRMPIVASICTKHAGCILCLLNRTDCYVWLYQKNLWLFIFEFWNAPDQWHNWRMTGVLTAPLPAKLNVKTGPLPWLYFGIYSSFVFSRLLFFCVFRSVFRWFRVLCSHSIPNLLLFLNYFLSVASGLPSAKFLPGSNLTAPDQSLRLYCR